MNRELALAEWQRARDALDAADFLTRGGFYVDAVSRTYYAILHAAKAALHVRDVAADSHAAVRRLFGLHLIRTGEVESEWAAYLSEGLDERLAADYNPQVTLSRSDARRECREARQVVGRIRRFLREQGFTNAELRRIAT